MKLPTISTNSIATPNIDPWHCRLGLVSYDKLFVLQKSCDICPLAKQRCLSFPVSTSHCNKVFQLLHMDIWGPLSIISIHGHRYFLTIVDDYSRHTWLFLMKHKFEVPSHIMSFVQLVENQFDCSIKKLEQQWIGVSITKFSSIKRYHTPKIRC